ncbi:hypothetical protein F0089_21670 [Salmonella enterica]|nr:hypothetical protein [Salmonella enterica]
MSHYSCLKIISTKAKKMARASSVLTHSQALEIIARQSKFSNYHELNRVAKYAPLEPRLLMAAFGDSDFADVIHNGVSLDIENYCTLRLFFVHLSCGMGARLTGGFER